MHRTKKMCTINTFYFLGGKATQQELESHADPGGVR